jgi:hypothetical protein
MRGVRRCRVATTLALAVMHVTLTHRSSAAMHGVWADVCAPPDAAYAAAFAAAPSGGAALPCLRRPDAGPPGGRGGLQPPMRRLLVDGVGARRREHGPPVHGGLWMLARRPGGRADGGGQSGQPRPLPGVPRTPPGALHASPRTEEGRAPAGDQARPKRSAEAEAARRLGDAAKSDGNPSAQSVCARGGVNARTCACMRVWPPHARTRWCTHAHARLC